MPTRASRICAYPRCPNLTAATYCVAHTYKRPSAFQRGYNDACYRAWRNEVLSRDQQCMLCGAAPKDSDHADHIVPIRAGGARYDHANGQRLCATCHDGPKQASDLRQYGPGQSPPKPALSPVFG